MDEKFANVLANLSRVSWLDRKLKSSKYQKAFTAISDLVKHILSLPATFALCNKDNELLFHNRTIGFIDAQVFYLKTVDSFSSYLHKFSYEALRRLLCQEVAFCEVASMPLIDLCRPINSIYDHGITASTEQTKRIRAVLEKNDNEPTVVYGNSSSGKTVAVAQAIEQIVTAGQYSFSWVDLTDVNIEIEHFVYTLFKAEKKKKHIVIIDNVQSHPSKIIWIKKALQFVESVYPHTTFQIVYICWRSALKSISIFYEASGCTGVECTGDDVIIELIRNNGLEKYEQEIIKNSAGDVLIAQSTIEFIHSTLAFPTESQLAQKLFFTATRNQALSNNSLLVLYHIVALGEFEIHVKKEYLDHISEEGVAELMAAGILRTYRAESNTIYISIGHRSLAHKLVTYLRTYLTGLNNPIDLAVQYLSLCGEQQILSTLERLDLELETNDSVLSKLWQAFCNMKYSVIKQIGADSTWGNNMASMIFAVEALNNMVPTNEISLALNHTAEEIRKRWGPADNNDGIVFIGKQYGIDETVEIIDFIENIKRTMKVDESKYCYTNSMKSDSIDYQLFHDNWLLGLLLGFEGSLKSNGKNKDAYIACAEKLQLPNGAFYPERVSWVTARMIMGLCQCGLQYSNPVVRKACNWLVQQIRPRNEMIWPEGINLQCGGWHSGTGVWNSDEQITLMCICALFLAQYPIRRNSMITSIIHEFWRCRENLEEHFKTKGAVLDIVWIIDVMLLDHRNPIELQDEIKDLTDYVLGKWSSSVLSSAEKETESSDVSFMAKELLQIVWSLLYQNIGQLLKGLELNYSAASNSKSIFISYRREEGGGSAFAQSLYQRLNPVFVNDIFLDVYDLNRESDDFEEKISIAIKNARIVIAIISDHCFDRACFPNYKNSEDVFFNELNTALSEHKHIIVVYNSSIKRPECPSKLEVNSEFYSIAKKLSRKNASFYDATVPDAMDRLSNEVIKKINYL